MRVNRTIKRTPILPPGNWNLSLFIYIFFLSYLVLSPLSSFFYKYLKSAFRVLESGFREGWREAFQNEPWLCPTEWWRTVEAEGSFGGGHSGFLDQASTLPWTMSSGGMTDRGWSSRRTAGLPSQNHERYLVVAQAFRRRTVTCLAAEAQTQTTRGSLLGSWAWSHLRGLCSILTGARDDAFVNVLLKNWILFFTTGHHI